jgi:hypothetical protein
MRTIHLITITIIAGLIFSACNKLTDLDSPKNELTTDKVFADSNATKAALFNCYVQLERNAYVNGNKFLATYVDETIVTNSSLQEWNQSKISIGENSNQTNWSELYSIIYQCNVILERLGVEQKIPGTLKIQIIAEAKFLRAYCYFNLINRYGKVPLIKSTEVNANRNILQSDSVTVYKQILDDLTDAKKSIAINYIGTGKIRANKAAVKAMLARFYLYQRNWPQAEACATELISSGNYTPLENPINIFKANSKESILQIASQTGFINEAAGIIPSSATATPNFYFSTEFYNSFEDTDLRRSSWTRTNTVSAGTITTTYHYPAKYKNRVANTTNPENLVLFRIAEQYLIRAEARAYQGKLTGTGSATEDINVIRSRADLLPINPDGLADVLKAIYLERRHELFFENADRFFDLKRTGQLQTVMAAAKPSWKVSSALLPIPLIELTNNKNLIQNEGY